jgi:hypothetical protein
MKKVALAITGIMTAGIVSVSFVASASADLDEAKKNIVVANCTNAQSTLQSISRSDTTTRINRGREYDKILKLFYAMNTRTATNNITEPKLTEITKSFENELNSFRALYNTYNDGLRGTIDTDCRQNPQGFYSSLEQSREKRAAINASVARLNSLIEDYQTSIGELIP